MLEDMEFVAYQIGMTREEFYEADMKEFEAKVKAYRKVEKKEDSRVALICTVIANSNKGKKGKKAKVVDFMPKEEQETNEQTWQEQLNKIKSINKALGGNKKGT